MEPFTAEPIRSPLEIRLFGPPDVRVDGKPLAGLHSRKGYSLLALLILRQDREVERDWLAGTLWPESLQSQAYYNLRENLADLRRALGAEAARLHAPTRKTLRLDLTGLPIDVVEFDSALRRSDPPSLEQAIALYRGPLMEGCGDAWLLPERQARENAYLDALERLAAMEMANGDPGRAAGHLQRTLAADPLRENALRCLLQALAVMGDHAGVVAAYRAFRLVLHQELNADPSAETVAMFRRLRNAAGQPENAVSTLSTGQGGAPFSPARLHAPVEAAPSRLEPIGGAVPLDSAFYIVRPADGELKAAIAGQDSIVLVKGARQVGKTSLLARGLQQARDQGARVALTDLQTLNEPHLASADALCLVLANTLALQSSLPSRPSQTWDSDLGASLNLEWFVRDQVLQAVAEPVVWGFDQVDRLFTCGFGSDVFGLFRSWHDRRALDPTGPWSRLTLVIAYATEAHLFITDLNQSPFNVGTRLTLEDFTPEQVAELNRRYGAPLLDDELERFYRLLGGQPYLTRLGLYEMAAHGRPLADLEAQADRDEGLFGSHLRRLYSSLSQDADLTATTRAVLNGETRLPPESFYRLRSAGILAGDFAGNVRLRCLLYASYLARRLP